MRGAGEKGGANGSRGLKQGYSTPPVTRQHRATRYCVVGMKDKHRLTAASSSAGVLLATTQITWLAH